MEQTAQRNRAEWFFSEDGHRAYASSGTTGEKTRYFFEYLRGLGQKTPDRVLYKLAYIMADSMDVVGGRFAGWPAILQGGVNPFIKLVVDGILQPAEEMERSLSTGWGFSRGVTKQEEEDGCRWWITDQLLCALHGISPVRRVVYEELQDSSAEDCDRYLYRIERQVIWLFGGDALMSPYSLRALFCEPFREQQADLGYRGMTDDQKTKAVESVYQYANEVAKETTLRDYEITESWVLKAREAANDHDFPVSDYVNLYASGINSVRGIADANGDTITNTASMRKAQMIYQMYPDLTSEQYNVLFDDFNVGKTVRGWAPALIDRKLAALGG